MLVSKAPPDQELDEECFMVTNPTEPQSALRMMDSDAAAKALGIVVETWEPGRAVLTMTIRGDMANGFAITHGGLVFALADTAFAYACNDGDSVTVASGADIIFLKSTIPGQTLRAVAERTIVVGRNGLYDVHVSDETGEAVAEFRGRSFSTNRPHLASA